MAADEVGGGVSVSAPRSDLMLSEFFEPSLAMMRETGADQDHSADNFRAR